MNYEGQFKDWIEDKFPNRGTNTSYMRALKILSDRFPIWDLNDTKRLSLLVKEVEAHQQSNNGKYYYKSPSYGKRGFYSAALKKYIEFLDGKK